MKQLFFLVEEPSMKEVLDALLPFILPPEVGFKIIKHEGKQDLERSIPRKLKAIQIPGVQFIVVRDQDSADCIQVKERLRTLCIQSGRKDSLVRIVCNELESWFLGDLAAVEQAFHRRGLAGRQGNAKYRNPDELHNAAQELKKLVPEYQKISGSRAIAQHMTPDNNCSHSFQVFIEGVRRCSSR